MDYLQFRRCSGLGANQLHRNNGGPVTIPLKDSLTQTLLPPASFFSTGQQNLIPPGAAIAVESDSSAPISQEGWSQLQTSSPAVTGFCFFHYQPLKGPASQGVVQPETRNALSYVLTYSNTGTTFTAVAVANITNAPVNVTVTLRDPLTGVIIDHGNFSLPAMGHGSFLLASTFTSSAGKTGSVEFSTGTTGELTVVGLVFDSVALGGGSTGYSFFSVPPIAKYPLIT